ncbi:MAG: type II toxin-antitoxin system Phd/YefM family antitoxin [Spirochaetia bacterium]|jgi:antitoxin (DNA-binding transcriptional repressor) of toxin-antitoxin stability system|nr:type II toxin-antitoxin system Phd/YefM family antitoxin [Spirochaetia bacterium]
MKFLSIRDLRSKSAQVWQELPLEREMVITNNGRPIAVISSVDEGTVESSLATWRQVRATQAIVSIQKESMKKGNDRISIEQIDSEINKTRRARQKRRI